MKIKSLTALSLLGCGLFMNPGDVGAQQFPCGGILVQEVGGRKGLLPQTQTTVSSVLGEQIANPIKEPQLNRVRNALIVVSKDRMQNLADLALDHVERIGRQGLMAAGSTTQMYLNETGNARTKVGQYACLGNNVTLPAGAKPVSGQGYFISPGMGASGGWMGPNLQHPNAPRLGNQLNRGFVQKAQQNGGGNNGGAHFGRAPNLMKEAIDAGETVNLRYQSSQDLFKSDPGNLGVQKSKEQAGEEIKNKLAPKPEKPKAFSASAHFEVFPQVKFDQNHEKLAENVFPKILISMPYIFHAFALNESERDVSMGIKQNRSDINVSKNNPENLATQWLAGMYWSIGIQDRVDASAALIENARDTERSQVRTLAGVVNALFIEMNQANGVSAVEGRSESLWDIVGQIVVPTIRGTNRI